MENQHRKITGYRRYQAELILLLRAAELIEQRGLCKRNFTDSAGRLCILGAINVAAGCPPCPPKQSSKRLDAEDAYLAIRRYLGIQDVSFWNDAPGRDAGDVIDALIGAAYWDSRDMA